MTMKEYAAFFITALFVTSCNSERTIDSDLAASNLKGKIIKIEKIVYKSEETPKCPCGGVIDNRQTRFNYNEKGNLTESSVIDEDGNVVTVSKYIYDRHDVCSGVKRFSGEKLTESEINIINKKRVTRTRVLDEMGKVESIIKYEYSGNQITGGQTLSSDDVVVSSFKNEYENGQVALRTDMDNLRKLSTETRYERNSGNDITWYTVTNKTDNNEYRIAFEYEYDDHGNWTKQTQRYNGAILGIIIRNITYSNL